MQREHWSSLSPIRPGWRSWALGGALLGLTVLLGIRLYEQVWMFGYLHPIFVFAFWPTSPFFYLWTGTSVFLQLAAWFGNAALYAAIAVTLRRASVALVAVLLLLVFSQLPPSDKRLARQFNQHRVDFEKLVSMSNTDQNLTEVTPVRVRTGDDTKTNVVSQRVDGLPQQRWEEYRRTLNAGQLKGFYRDTSTGQIFLLLRSSHTLGRFGTWYGFLYCPTERPPLGGGYVACSERKESATRSEYRYKRLDSDWYIYEVFEEYSLD
jgi:hypothetical protein